MATVARDAGRASAAAGGYAPADAGDFYGLMEDLPAELVGLRRAVRRFMEEEVEPLVAEAWEEAAFPAGLVARFRAQPWLAEAYAPTDAPALREAALAFEMARVDVSVATAFGAHTGLAMRSIELCGSPEQQAEWLPAMRTWERIGAFALTEPEVGSGVARGITTTCRRDGDAWVLDGRKKWIGNAPFADLIIVWARDPETDAVLGFVVEADTPGVEIETLQGKISQRINQNGLITFRGARVPERNRLREARGFRDTARVLASSRAGVAWNAIGAAAGAFEASLAYAKERRQFGRPIAAFQLVQMRLARMAGLLVSVQAMGLRLARMQDAGDMREEHASLGKMFCAAQAREVVALARETLGGNGILLEHRVARFFADVEGIYSYEGTHDINGLVVGRALTGHGAFV